MNINVSELEERIKSRLEALEQEKLRLLEQLKIVHKTKEIAATFDLEEAGEIHPPGGTQYWEGMREDEAPV